MALTMSGEHGARSRRPLRVALGLFGMGGACWLGSAIVFVIGHGAPTLELEVELRDTPPGVECDGRRESLPLGTGRTLRSEAPAEYVLVDESAAGRGFEEAHFSVRGSSLSATIHTPTQAVLVALDLIARGCGASSWEVTRCARFTPACSAPLPLDGCLGAPLLEDQGAGTW